MIHPAGGLPAVQYACGAHRRRARPPPLRDQTMLTATRLLLPLALTVALAACQQADSPAPAEAAGPAAEAAAATPEA
ncbi:hypothetical protein ACQYWP_18335, partial [Luteimonas sp. SDU101]